MVSRDIAVVRMRVGLSSGSQIGKTKTCLGRKSPSAPKAGEVGLSQK
jgi:hypothetical protein